MTETEPLHGSSDVAHESEVHPLPEREPEPDCVDPQCDGNHSTEDDPRYDDGFHPPMPSVAPEPKPCPSRGRQLGNDHRGPCAYPGELARAIRAESEPEPKSEGGAAKCVDARQSNPARVIAKTSGNAGGTGHPAPQPAPIEYRAVESDRGWFLWRGTPTGDDNDDDGGTSWETVGPLDMIPMRHVPTEPKPTSTAYCTVTVTTKWTPAETQSRDDVAYSTGPCGRVMPCADHPNDKAEPIAPGPALTLAELREIAGLNKATWERDVAERDDMIAKRDRHLKTASDEAALLRNTIVLREAENRTLNLNARKLEATLAERDATIKELNDNTKHRRVFEYDGAFRCLTCKAQWGVLPGNPKMPERCEPNYDEKKLLEFLAAADRKNGELLRRLTATQDHRNKAYVERDEYAKRLASAEERIGKLERYTGHARSCAAVTCDRLGNRVSTGKVCDCGLAALLAEEKP